MIIPKHAFREGITGGGLASDHLGRGYYRLGRERMGWRYDDSHGYFSWPSMNYRICISDTTSSPTVDRCSRALLFSETK